MSHDDDDDDDPYAVLGLTPPCTPRTLRRTYLQRARRVHPDKHPDDPNATHEFQRLSHAYHVLQTAHRTHSDNDDGDDSDTIDIQQYKAMYETLSARAVAFWRSERPEAKLLHTLWAHWTTATTTTSSSSSDGWDSACSDSDSDCNRPKTTTTPPATLHFTLRPTLTEAFANTHQKVTYTRRTPKGDESCTVLVPAACTQFTLYGEGDVSDGEGDATTGDVVFHVQPIVPDGYRIVDDRLHRDVDITPHELVHGVRDKSVDVCGTKCTFTIAPRLYERWALPNGNCVTVDGVGLLDVSDRSCDAAAEKAVRGSVVMVLRVTGV